DTRAAERDARDAVRRLGHEPRQAGPALSRDRRLPRRALSDRGSRIAARPQLARDGRHPRRVGSAGTALRALGRDRAVAGIRVLSAEFRRHPLTHTTCFSVCTTSTRSVWSAITLSMSL